MQRPYNSPGGYLVHVLFSQCVYFPINGPGWPSGKPRYHQQKAVSKIAQMLPISLNSYMNRGEGYRVTLLSKNRVKTVVLRGSLQVLVNTKQKQ